jgi:transcriptional regulator
MYTPPAFRNADPAVALELMRSHPFATVIATGADGAPVVNHLPLLVAGDTLVGHMAKRNPQAAALAATPAATAVFHGPHAYISPTWYEVDDVPTWNYAVVHVRGRARLIEDHAELVALLEAATAAFEGDGPGAWKVALPDDLAGDGALARQIVGVELAIERVDCKLKLSQNRSLADRRGVLRGLEERGDAESAALRRALRRYADPS